MEKTKKKSLLIAGIAAAVVVAAIVVGVVVWMSGSTDRAVQKQLDLANQYLIDMDYEEAVAAYLVAIDIEPKTIGAYLGAAEAYAAMDDYDSAIDILAQGLDEIPDEAIMTSQLSETINTYSDLLLADGCYDEIRSLAEQYGDYELDVDFDAIIEDAEAAESAETAESTP